ncbi:MAG: hypothetical protein ACOYOB_09980 [Myxococcota bacterium]
MKHLLSCAALCLSAIALTGCGSSTEDDATDAAQDVAVDADAVDTSLDATETVETPDTVGEMDDAVEPPDVLDVTPDIEETVVPPDVAPDVEPTDTADDATDTTSTDTVEPVGNVCIEAESNNTLATATDLDPYFAQAPDSPMQLPVKVDNVLVWGAFDAPWLEVKGSGDGTVDYYKVTVPKDSYGVFDVDQAGVNGTDLSMSLWDAQGTALGGNDTLAAMSWYFGPDKGSEGDNDKDPYIGWQFGGAGTYYLGVAATGAKPVNGGFPVASPPVPAGATYRLFVAVKGHPVVGK